MFKNYHFEILEYKKGDFIIKTNKFLIVLAILLTSFIVIGAASASSDITVTDAQDTIDNNNLNNLNLADSDIQKDNVVLKEGSFNFNLSTSPSSISINDEFNVTAKWGGVSSKVTGNATLFINGIEKETKVLKDQKGNVKFTNCSLPALGSYNITVKIYNDTVLSTNSIIVNVNPSATINIVNISDIQYGDYLSFDVTFPNDTSGTIRIFLDDDTVFALGENSTITGGVTSFSVRNTGKLTVGNHSIVAKLTKSNVYADSISEPVNFTVSQKIVEPSDMFIEQYDPALKYGDNGIYIKFNFKVTGNVILVSDGQNISSKFVNDSDRVSFKNITLEPGRHNVSFIFEGNENYSSQSIDSINIMCVPIITPVVIGGHENRTVGEPIKITVNLRPNTTGRFDLVYSNGTIFSSKNLVNDSHFEFDDFTLSMGIHKLNILYYGLSDNSTVTNNITIYVTEKANTTVTVDHVKGKAGQKVTITARVTDENGNPVNEGTVIIGFNGKEYEAQVVDGIATVKVVLPKAGNYSATAYYEGINYNSSYTTFTVEVSDIPGPNPDPNPTPKKDVNNSVGNMENTGNPLLVLLVALCAIGLESFRRKF